MFLGRRDCEEKGHAPDIVCHGLTARSFPWLQIFVIVSLSIERLQIT